jgi:hypothetical protein
VPSACEYFRKTTQLLQTAWIRDLSHKSNMERTCATNSYKHC